MLHHHEQVHKKYSSMLSLHMFLTVLNILQEKMGHYSGPGLLILKLGDQANIYVAVTTGHTCFLFSKMNIQMCQICKGRSNHCPITMVQIFHNVPSLLDFFETVFQ